MSWYTNMIKCLAAINCYNAGQSVAEIAKSAKVSETTVRRWLKTADCLRTR